MHYNFLPTSFFLWFSHYHSAHNKLLLLQSTKIPSKSIYFKLNISNWVTQCIWCVQQLFTKLATKIWFSFGLLLFLVWRYYKWKNAEILAKKKGLLTCFAMTLKSIDTFVSMHAEIVLPTMYVWLFKVYTSS